LFSSLGVQYVLSHSTNLDTQQNDNQHNDIQHTETQHISHSACQKTAIMLSVAFYLLLCWMSLCCLSLCWLLLCWMALCWVSLSWVAECHGANTAITHDVIAKLTAVLTDSIREMTLVNFILISTNFQKCCYILYSFEYW